MGLFGNHFVDVKRGTKITYSESDLRKLDRTYEKEVFPEEKKRIMSGFRKVPQQAYLSRVRDYAFERILDNHMYTFQHLLVIPNPYDLVKQSALLLFNSSKETKIRYKVLGDTPEADFVGETEYTKRHRVPIMGLYLDCSNKVELEMFDLDGNLLKRRMIRIYVSGAARNENTVLGKIVNKKLSHFSFIIINGFAFDPIVIDCNGAIRYSIQLHSKRIGMIPLENGHFLYEDRTANRVSKSGRGVPCRYHEMDYLGRVYRTFLLDFHVRGVKAQKGAELFLLTDTGKKGENKIICLNLKDGKIAHNVNLPNKEQDVFGQRICRCVPEGADETENGIQSRDGAGHFVCLDLRKKKLEDKKASLIERDSGTGGIVRQIDFKRAFNMAWLFEPDILQFCSPAEQGEQVLFGELASPEEFTGQLPPEAEEPIERFYFGGIRLCDDLFLCRILPGRIDRIYFVGKKHAYVQDYSGLAASDIKLSFVISMAEFETDEYKIFIESRKVVHRLKNMIRVVN